MPKQVSGIEYAVDAEAGVVLAVAAAQSDGAADSARLRHDLRAIMGDGAAFSVMVGVGETYLPAYVLAMGLGELSAGLITTLPMVGGALLQWLSPLAIRRLGSNRRWVVACATLQGLSFLPLIVGAWLGRIPAAIVFLSAALYWGGGLATGPAWNSWVSTIVPARIRTRYFARRTRVSQAGVLCGFLIGGFSLQAGTYWGHPLWAFCGIFLAASLARAVSTCCLFSQHEPIPPSREHRHVSAGELWGKVRNGEKTLLVYLLAVQMAAQIAGPYFTPFMLRQLHFSYLQFVTLLGVSFFAKIAMTPYFGRLAQRHGPRRLLMIGGTAIVPISAMWLVSNTFEFLLVLQFAAGCAWAAYELAMFLLFFETIHENERVSVLTHYNVGHAVANAAGSLLGGAILLTAGESKATYLGLFLLSSLARLATLVILRRAPHATSTGITLATRTLAVRPADGGMDRPILSSLSDDAPRDEEPPAAGTLHEPVAFEPAAILADDVEGMQVDETLVTDRPHADKIRSALKPARTPTKVGS